LTWPHQGSPWTHQIDSIAILPQVLMVVLLVLLLLLLPLTSDQ
jgi:hypothetical protein